MNPILKYFSSEQKECTSGIGISLVSLFFGVYFLLKHLPVDTGLGIAFLIAAVVQFVVCFIVIRRTPKDIARVMHDMQTDKSKIISEEIPRMKTVLKNFMVYRWGEIFLIMAAFGSLPILGANSLGSGFAIGIGMQAALLLVFDIPAERRGKVYLEYLKKETS